MKYISILLISFMFMATSAMAVTISANFSGQIDQVNDQLDDLAPEYLKKIGVGDTFTGYCKYSYNKVPVGPYPNFYPIGFDDSGLTIEYNIQIGDLIISNSADWIDTENSGQLWIYDEIPNWNVDYYLEYASLSIFNESPFTGFPENFNDLLFKTGVIELFAYVGAPSKLIRGNITSFSPVPTPEPTTLVLVCTGLGYLFMRKNKKI